MIFFLNIHILELFEHAFTVKLNVDINHSMICQAMSEFITDIRKKSLLKVSYETNNLYRSFVYLFYTTGFQNNLFSANL